MAHVTGTSPRSSGQTTGSCRRSASAKAKYVGYNFYPKSFFFSRIGRPSSPTTARSAAATRRPARGAGRVVRRQPELERRARPELGLRPGRRKTPRRGRTCLLDRPFTHENLSRISINGNVGEDIDFDNSREGDGVRFGTSVTVRPTDHLALELIANRRWLDVQDRTEAGREGRLFTASVARLSAAYMFTARALCA